MRIRFIAATAKGPRVIPLIPDLRLCYLEGRNGIGKTLAIRLLELATGGQPFRALPAAWRTLRQQLGDVEIHVDDLKAGPGLRIRLTPSRWPVLPDLDIDDDLLGEAWRDGNRITFDAVRKLVLAFRIGGEETLEQTVATEVSVRAQGARRLVDIIQRQGEVWDDTLSELVEMTRDLSQMQVEAAHLTAIQSAENELNSAGFLDAAQTELKRALDATNYLRAVSSLREKETVLLGVVTESRDRLKKVTKRLREADERVSAASMAAAGGASAEAALVGAEKLRAGREHRMHVARLEERDVLRRLGLEAPLKVNEARWLRDKTNAALTKVTSRLAELDLVSPLQQLTAELESPLSRRASALGKQVLLPKPPLTVHEVLDGVRRRAEELKGEPKPDEVQSLIAERERLQERVRALYDLVEAMRNVERKSALLDESNDQIVALWGAIGAADLSKRRAAQKKREQLRGEQFEVELAIASARAEIAQLRQQAGLSDLPDDAARVHPIQPAQVLARFKEVAGVQDADSMITVAATGPPPNSNDPEVLLSWVLDWRTDLEAAIADLTGTWEADAALAKGASGALDALHRRELYVLDRMSEPAFGPASKAFLSALSANGEADFQDVWAEIQALDGRFENGAPVTAERRLTEAAQLVHRLADRLAEDARIVTRGADSLYSYLVVQARRLDSASSQQAGQGEDVIADEPFLRRWLEDELAVLFGAPELRAELFDHADEVSFALEDLVLRWQGNDGQWRRRPLEAFSSGEQAFAYTRARLERLSGSTANVPDVLVVLDEFGAFVARDRLGHLLRFVQIEALDTFATQAVVMLPLSIDLPIGKASTPAGDGPDHRATEADQVAGWDYFCRDALELPLLASANP